MRSGVKVGRRKGRAPDATTAWPADSQRFVSGSMYSSPAVFQREITCLFRRDWLFVGRVEELASVGAYLTAQLVGESVAIARAKDGQLHAWHNRCLHRGVEIAQGRGNARAFKCSFHDCVYDLTGRLIGPARMDRRQQFDASDCSVQPIRIDTWQGNIFICFDSHAPPLTKFVADFESEVRHLQMNRCCLTETIALDVECNWKLIHENTIREKGGIDFRYDAPTSMPSGTALFGKMPWLQDKGETFACARSLAPNFALFGRIDCIQLMVAWPQSASRCQVHLYHLLPERALKRPDIAANLKRWHDHQVTLLEENRRRVESIQQAITSGSYLPRTTSTVDKPLSQFLTSYRDRMLGLSTCASGSSSAASSEAA